MSKRNTQHVVPAPEGGWNVKKGGASKATKHFDKKTDAVDYGRTVSQNQGAELVIHGTNGKIQNSDSHGNDPLPPQDTK